MDQIANLNFDSLQDNTTISPTAQAIISQLSTLLKNAACIISDMKEQPAPQQQIDNTISKKELQRFIVSSGMSFQRLPLRQKLEMELDPLTPAVVANGFSP